jgi:hypothetical protein
MAMSKQDTERAFEARTKAAFDASVEALDAATRARLTQARVRALEALSAPRGSVRQARWLVPAGAAAAAALAAWLVLVGPGERAAEPLQAAALSDLEVLLAEEALEMIEDLDFYAWLEEQPEFEPSADGAAGDGVG